MNDRLLDMTWDGYTIAHEPAQWAIAALAARMSERAVANNPTGRASAHSVRELMAALSPAMTGGDRMLCGLVTELAAAAGISERELTLECERAGIW